MKWQQVNYNPQLMKISGECALTTLKMRQEFTRRKELKHEMCQGVCCLSDAKRIGFNLRRTGNN